MNNSNSNSLLKQQLRAGLKEIEIHTASGIGTLNAATTITPINNNTNQTNTLENQHESACSALQSLATVAERQIPNAIQPSNANNLHQQFLLHMAANPILKTGVDFFQQQQLQQQQQQSLLQRDDDDPNDKSEPELTLVDESAGLEYKALENNSLNETNGSLSSSTPATPSSNSKSNGNGSRPVQRRRIRRKAQSSVDDQAEHLTEMSVRGLDLFRYASISEGVYKCTECAKENMQKTFKNKYSFQRHAFLYHEGKHRKVFPCPLCGKEFSRPDKMKNHMKMTHENATVPKEINNLTALNYLIAAGDIHNNFLQQQQQQHQHQQKLAQQQQDEAQHQQAQDLKQSFALLEEEDLIRNQKNAVVEFGQAAVAAINFSKTPSALIAPAIAMLKLQQNDIVIKTENSPPPSPTPSQNSPTISESPVVSVSVSGVPALTQTTAPRLEEVK